MCALKIIDRNMLTPHLTPRERSSHKGDYGRDLIYAGSPGMAGAAILSARSALRSGAGLVSCLLPSFEGALLPILQTGVPEATCLEISSVTDFNRYDAIGCGPGLGTGAEAAGVLKSILTNYKKNLILDADALNMAAADPEIRELVRTSPANVIITPHIGEARRLLNTSAALSDEESRVEAAVKLSEIFCCTAVLKSHETIVASNDGTGIIYKNVTGNPGMATGGSGDVLTGVLTALAGQEKPPVITACLGVYIHSIAGDIAAKRLGQTGMISSDICSALPEAFERVSGD